MVQVGENLTEELAITKSCRELVLVYSGITYTRAVNVAYKSAILSGNWSIDVCTSSAVKKRFVER